MEPSKRAISQYSTTTDKLAQRVAILSYDTNTESWYPWLSSRLPVAGNDVLEAGSGTGDLWRHLDASNARSLTLTDFSFAMCNRLKELRLPRANVQQCDAASLPFADATFDLVIANHMLYHLDDPSAALQEFVRVLRPDGRLRVSLNGRDHIAELLELGAAVGRPSPIVDAARISAETAPELLSRYCKDVTVERFPGAFHIPEPGPALTYLASWGEDAMTVEQEGRAREWVGRKIKEDGRFTVKKNMVLFSAVKP